MVAEIQFSWNWGAVRHVPNMLFIEKGGDAQLADELDAYNPLVPKGDEPVATLMFEIDDRPRRERLLSALGGAESTVSIRLAGEIVTGAPEGDVERSTEDGPRVLGAFPPFPLHARPGEEVPGARRPGGARHRL